MPRGRQQYYDQAPAPHPAPTTSISIPFALVSAVVTIFVTVGGSWFALNKQITEIHTSYNLTTVEAGKERQNIRDSVKDLRVDLTNKSEDLKRDLTAKLKESTSKFEFDIAQNRSEVKELRSKLDNLSSTVDELYSNQMKLMNSSNSRYGGDNADESPKRNKR